jgi:hypothetical protein
MKYSKTFFLILIGIYYLIQLRGFLTNDYSLKYNIFRSSDIIKLTQEHPSMPGWKYQFISTIINSCVETKQIDTIFISNENYEKKEINLLFNYYSKKYKFLFSDSTLNIKYLDSSICYSYWLKHRYIAKWHIGNNTIYFKHGTQEL